MVTQGFQGFQCKMYRVSSVSSVSAKMATYFSFSFSCIYNFAFAEKLMLNLRIVRSLEVKCTPSSSQISRKMKDITLRVPDEMVPLLEEWAKHIPEMEVVCRKESVESDLDDIDRRMALAFEVLIQNGTLNSPCDYTWIMVAIGDGAVNGMGAFRSPQSYMDYMKSIGVKSIPSRATLSAWYNKVIGTYPEWEFTDTRDPQEIQKRKNIARQFISALNKAF